MYTQSERIRRDEQFMEHSSIFQLGPNKIYTENAFISQRFQGQSVFPETMMGKMSVMPQAPQTPLQPDQLSKAPQKGHGDTLSLHQQIAQRSQRKKKVPAPPCSKNEKSRHNRDKILRRLISHDPTLKEPLEQLDFEDLLEIYEKNRPLLIAERERKRRESRTNKEIRKKVVEDGEFDVWKMKMYLIDKMPDFRNQIKILRDRDILKMHEGIQKGKRQRRRQREIQYRAYDRVGTLEDYHNSKIESEKYQMRRDISRLMNEALFGAGEQPPPSMMYGPSQDGAYIDEEQRKKDLAKVIQNTQKNKGIGLHYPMEDDDDSEEDEAGRKRRYRVQQKNIAKQRAKRQSFGKAPKVQKYEQIKQQTFQQEEHYGNISYAPQTPQNKPYIPFGQNPFPYPSHHPMERKGVCKVSFYLQEKDFSHLPGGMSDIISHLSNLFKTTPQIHPSQ